MFTFTPPAMFFNQLATLTVLAYPQDAAGGEVLTPKTVRILVPCCVQQEAGPEQVGDGQKRRGSQSHLRVFLRPRELPGQDLATVVAGIGAMKVNDQLQVSGLPNPVSLDGPFYDSSGRGAVFEARARDTR